MPADSRSHARRQSEGDCQGLKALQRSKRLRKLNVAKTSVGAGLGEALASWSELEALLAQGSKVDDEAVKSIPELPRLQNLSLADTAVTEGGLARLVERCPNLREISGGRRKGTFYFSRWSHPNRVAQSEAAKPLLAGFRWLQPCR